MRKTKRDHSLGEGVYFAHDDYAGLMRRVVILCVDSAVLVMAGAALYVVAGFLYPILGDRVRLLLLFWVVLAYVYLAILKPSPIRTVGYWIADVKILTLRGQRPSILRMTFRLMLWAFGPFNFLLDLFWVGIDEDSQTLRDRFAGTCVVRNQSQPVGRGEIHLAYYDAFGFNLMYPRVTK